MDPALRSWSLPLDDREASHVLPFLIRVHRFKLDALLVFTTLLASPQCKGFEGLFSLCPVVFGIYHYSDIFVLILVDHKTGQILDSIEGLSSLPIIVPESFP